MGPTAAERLAEFSLGLAEEDVPGEVKEAVCLHLLDVLGCGIGGVAAGAAPYAMAMAEGSGVATAIGVPRALPPSTAALVNGILCHALDFDDTHPASIAHVSAVVAPAALAAAQEARACGGELMLALLVGSEVACRVGRPVGDAFHLRGFHPTAICGIFGAATATARLGGLDSRRTVQALGIAGSMAAGLMAYLGDGSATKPIHPGWMAHAAHTAVALARAGATGPAAILEGPSGVYDAFLGRGEIGAAEVAGDLGTVWETPGIAFKPYAGCHFLHAPLDALLALSAEQRFGPDDVARITVFSPPAGVGLICDPPERKRRPATAYEAKFSAPFTLSAALVLGRTDAGIFSDRHLRDPEILSLAARIDHEELDYESFPRSLPGGVAVELTDGRRLDLHVPHQRGGAANPMSAEEVVEKFRANASGALPPDLVAELERAALSLPALASSQPFELLGAVSAGGEA